MSSFSVTLDEFIKPRQHCEQPRDITQRACTYRMPAQGLSSFVNASSRVPRSQTQLRRSKVNMLYTD